MDTLCSPEMPRRAFMAIIAGSLLAAPLAAEAQPRQRVARVAFLEAGNMGADLWQVTRDSLRELGYVEGQNLIIEFRSADGQFERLPALLVELIRLQVDVIVVAGDAVVVAAKEATSTIPIVMAAVSDPLGRGFVASLARPGGNLTGTSNLAIALTAKWVELAKELVRGLSRVAILGNGANPTHPRFWTEAESSAREIGLTVYKVDARSSGEFDHAFASMAHERVGAVVILPDPMLRSGRTRLSELAAKHRLPSIFPIPPEGESVGGLISYGPSLRTNFRRAATYVDQILKGAKPGDLPIQQPTAFELVINLKTAKALGLTIPASLLQRADQVIE
jgi:putative ABC transport system substrate-binding protein